MASESEIYDAGALHLASLSTSNPIAYPAVPFEPPTADDAMWFELRFFPNDTQNLGWGDTDKSLFVGAFRVLVYFRPKRGLFDPTVEAEAIVAHFAKGTELGPVRVSKRPYLAPVVNEEGLAFIPVTIEYRGIA